MDNYLQLPFVPQSLPFTCGPACFASMYQYIRGSNLDELHFANLLGTMSFGFTPPIKVYHLGLKLGFNCQMKEKATWEELFSAVIQKKVVFVTWWYEDAGHYCLVKGINDDSIILMDPLIAQDGIETILKIDFFIEQWTARGNVMIEFKK